MLTYTRAIFITGNDDRGNEYAYWTSSESNTPEIESMGKWDEWFDMYNEHYVSAEFVANNVIPNIVKVCFGDLEVNREEWLAAGCPYELTSDEIAAWMAHKLAHKLAVEAAQITDFEANKLHCALWAAEVLDDPRTAAQLDNDEWQTEVVATREADRPM